MASSALIDDLLKQFAENPRRVFARLANEYRKNGELDTAIEICRAHVPLQPTYISGYIVLGQALYESGQLDEARSTFETALGLDPENLIALRQLGDIARAHTDLTGARAWYRRLLEVDPQNEEIAAQLRDLDAPAGVAPVVTSQADQMGVSWSDIHPEHAPPPPPPDVADAHVAPTAETAPAQRLDFDFDVLSAFSTESEPAAHDAPPPVTAEPEGIPAPSEPESADVAAHGSAPPLRDDAGAIEEEPALAGRGGGGEGGEREQTAAPAAPAAPVETSAGREAASVEAQDESLPAAFITETMAELYLQQGHREQALDIYRLLLAQRPGDLSLLHRIAKLESVAPAAQPERTVRAFFGRFAQRRPPGATPAAVAAVAAAQVVEYVDAPVAPFEAEAHAPAPSALETASPAPAPGEEAPAASASEPYITEFEAFELEADPVVAAAFQPAPEPIPEPASEPERVAAVIGPREPTSGHSSSFAELFGGSGATAADEQAATTLAGAYAADGDTSNGVGRPARAATDALSLDDVFGGGAAQHESGAVSFDEFFATPNGAPAAPQPAGNSSAVSAAPQRSDDADLELFHAWLEGLKK